MQIAGWLNTEWLRSASYLAAVAACVVGGRRDAASPRSDRWPRFWFGAAGVLAVLTFGRVTGFASWMYDRGRQEALSGGWYWSRRPVQALAVAVVGALAVWSALAVQRRMGGLARRFLVPALCVVALVAFAATRLVSLHQVDTLLYRRPILGARIASIVELLGTALLVATALHATARRHPPGSHIEHLARPGVIVPTEVSQPTPDR